MGASEKLQAALHTGEAPPTAIFARPKPHEEWRVYISGEVKVRKLSSGSIQVATGYGEWKDVD